MSTEPAETQTAQPSPSADVESAIAAVRADVATLHGELVRYGLIVWTGGNVSGRVPGADLFVIKPSGVSYDDLAPENMILCDLDGNVIPGTPGSERSPSSDTAAHAYVYRHMPDVGGVVHTHSTFAVAWAARGEEIPCVITAMADEFGGPIPIGPFAIIGDDSIGRGIVETLTGHRSRAVLMQNHGPFTIGVNAKDAVKAAVMVEDVARTVHYRARGGAAHPHPAGGDRQPVRPLPERLRPERGRAAMSGGEGVTADAAREAILAGRTSLGIELGSTRIKACLIARRPGDGARRRQPRVGEPVRRPASGPTRWMPCGRGCRRPTPTSSPTSRERYDVTPQTFGAIGVSAMMHGYLAVRRRRRAAGAVPHVAQHDDRRRIRRAHRSCSGSTSRCAGRSRTCTRPSSTTSRTCRGCDSSRRSPGTCTGGSPGARCSASATRRACSPSTPPRRTTTPAAARTTIARPGACRSTLAALLPEVLVAGRAAGRADGRGCRAARSVGCAAAGGRAVPARRRRRHRHGRDLLGHAAHRQRQRRHEHLRDGRARAAARSTCTTSSTS